MRAASVPFGPAARLALGALAALVLGALALGCGKGDATSCKAVSARVVELLERDVERGGDPDRLAEARVNLPPLRDALLQSCVDGEWSEAVRRCIAEARNADELDACDPGGAATAPATEAK